jgi:beta-galactosidase
MTWRSWWQRDLEALVLRDRNHPSVVMWSIGNEVPPQNTTLKRHRVLLLLDGVSVRICRRQIPMRFSAAGVALAQQMKALIESLDAASGRAVTSAYPLIHEQDSPFLHTLDVAGYNYAGPGIYDEDHKRLPNRTFVGTESFAQASFTMWSQVRWRSKRAGAVPNTLLVALVPPSHHKSCAQPCARAYLVERRCGACRP